MKQLQHEADRLTYKVPEASKILGINAHTLRRLIARGEIKVVRALRHPLIPAEELKRFASV
jgi:excisionase family DNA binding protein